MLSSKIKIKHVNNLTDARYFAAWHVDWIGYDLDSSSAFYIEPQLMQDIREWIEGPATIGEFSEEQDLEIIQQTIEFLKLDGVQLSTFHGLDVAMALHGEVLVFKEIVYDATSDLDFIEGILSQHKGYVDYFVLNFSAAELPWTEIDQAGLNTLCTSYQILLDIDFPVSEITALCAQAKGFALAGGEEEKVGFKSFDDLDEIFEALEIFE